MKTVREFGYSQIIMMGFLTELVLILLQFIYVRLIMHAEVAAFTTEYMKSTGFYVFQVIGFFLYLGAISLLLRKVHVNKFYKVLLFLIAGGVIELAFYLLIPANYEAAYLYSIFDKFIAAAFATFIYNFSTHKV